MFNNIGEKIKSVAVVVTILGIATSLFLGIWMCAKSAWLMGVCIIIVGSICSWLGSLTLYGFGQLISNSDIMVKMQDKNNDNIEKIVKGNIKAEKPRKSPVAVEIIKVDGLDISDYYETAKQKTENLKDKQRRAIVMEHKDWARNVEKSTTKDLCETLDEIDEWDEDFVTLTCLEIVYRAETRNNK